MTDNALSQATAAAKAACGGDGITAAKIIGLLIGYHARWSGEPLEPVAVELEFKDVPILNPETGHKSKTFTQAGKLDGVVKSSRGKFLIEHKTCSEDIEDSTAPYWQRLAIDSQISMYSLAHWQDDSRLDGTIYDVIRKPTIKPKQIPAGSKKNDPSLRRQPRFRPASPLGMIEISSI